VRGLPLLKPPYGILTAINLDKGDVAWEVAHGETPDNVRNSPALKGLNIPRTGRTGLLGPLVTKTLVIIGEAGFFTAPNGQRGAMLRAYDKATGKEVGAIFMPAPQSGSPMTYMLNGQQYLAIAISGGNYSAELVVYKLPSGNSGSPATQSREMQPTPTGAQVAASSAPLYTAAQAGRGQAQYTQQCASCHGQSLEGIEIAPPLAGPDFVDKWTGQSDGRPVRTHPHHHAQKQTRQPHPRGGRRHHRLHPQREPVPGQFNRFACRHAAVEGNSNRCRKTAVIYTDTA
jgi:mono/diheme cytochrome c family protein